MRFCKKKIQTNCSIYFDGERIERVSETKFLGVIIDDKLSWKIMYLIYVQSCRRVWVF